MEYYDPNEHWMRQHEDDMDEDERLKVAIVQCVSFITILIVVLALCALLGSCTTTKVVTVEKVRTDTTYITKHKRDSIYLHDSTFIKVAGDTVLIERWHTKWQNHLEHDTIYRSRVDSVPVPYPVEKLVEKPRSNIEKGLMAFGGLSLMTLIVLLAWKVKKFLP